MADPKFEALMAVLQEQKILLAGLPGLSVADKTAVENRMNETISSLRGDYERAKTDKEKDAVYDTVAGLAGGFTAMAERVHRFGPSRSKWRPVRHQCVNPGPGRISRLHNKPGRRPDRRRSRSGFGSDTLHRLDDFQNVPNRV